MIYNFPIQTLILEDGFSILKTSRKRFFQSIKYFTFSATCNVIIT